MYGRHRCWLLVGAACLMTPGCAGRPQAQSIGSHTSSTTAAATTTPASQQADLDKPAGEIFGMPVSLNNYYFAKRVAYTFASRWELHQTKEQREQQIWDDLILSYEAFRRDIHATDDEVGPPGCVRRVRGPGVDAPSGGAS